MCHQKVVHRKLQQEKDIFSKGVGPAILYRNKNKNKKGRREGRAPFISHPEGHVRAHDSPRTPAHRPLSDVICDLRRGPHQPPVQFANHPPRPRTLHRRPSSTRLAHLRRTTADAADAISASHVREWLFWPPLFSRDDDDVHPRRYATAVGLPRRRRRRWRSLQARTRRWSPPVSFPHRLLQEGSVLL